MVRTAPTASAAKAEASASLSCAIRERRRTLRPDTMIGTTMSGSATSTKAESFGLVQIISATAPTSSTALRNAMEIEAPKAAFTCVVSAVRRETSSPTRLASKKAGSS